MIRLGVIGFAHGHANAILGEWFRDPDKYRVQPVCFWDENDERAETALSKYPKMDRMSSVEALLASDISAVLITCETALHAEAAIKAAEAGKDIILYKPMALTLQEADRIVDAVERNGVRFTMGWQMRTDPQNIRMKEMIDGGELGKVCLFRRRHGLSVHKWDGFENTWHNDPKMNRDIFADDSAHPINLMQWYFGMPDSVMCEMSTMVNPKVPNDNGVALFRYPNGMIAEITLCFTTCAADPTTEIYFTDGTVIQRYGDAPGTKLKPREEGLVSYKWGDADWTPSNIPSPSSQGVRLAAQAGRLSEFLHGGAPVCDAKEGRDSLRLVLACYLSARTGQRVSVFDPRIYDI
ncbi:MAG: Gfo/Idh/MocA family oxidoreductase [Clostridia bacterium]|nr:Gfo/Idh/MocA family oxidoreductase [Clostridia bacterium]